MDEMQEVVLRIQELWHGLSLEMLREEAMREINGTCFRSIRTNAGHRLALVFCFTGEHELRPMTQLASLNEERRFQFDDWKSVSLLEATSRAILGGGFCFDLKTDRSGKAVALIFAAAGPKNVEWLEGILQLPP